MAKWSTGNSMRRDCCAAAERLAGSGGLRVRSGRGELLAVAVTSVLLTFVILGAPKDWSSRAFRPFGPRVTCSSTASVSTDCRKSRRLTGAKMRWTTWHAPTKVDHSTQSIFCVLHTCTASASLSTPASIRARACKSVNSPSASSTASYVTGACGWFERTSAPKRTSFPVAMPRTALRLADATLRFIIFTKKYFEISKWWSIHT